MNKGSRIPVIVLAVVLLGGAFGGGMYVQAERAPVLAANPVETSADFQTFWKAWQIINEKYVPNGASSTPDAVTDQEKVWGAIGGLTKSLGDPYTVFFKPEQEKAFQSQVSGQFDGVGMEIGIKDNTITVVAPMKGTPAYKAGIKAGDKIIKIDGKTTEELAVDQAVQLIRGKKGTQVTLSVFRANEGILPDFVLTRDTIEIPAGEDKQVSVPVTPKKNTGTATTGGGSTGGTTATTGGSSTSGTATTGTGSGSTATAQPAGPSQKETVFSIRLFSFSATSVDTFKDKIQKFVDSGSDKLILDLRGNPGGYLDAAVQIASFFLPKDTVIVTENHGKDEKEIVYKSEGYNVFPHPIKMMVLVDGGSASASEILAGALSENGVAKLVGEKTFGKGSVQQLIPLTDTTAIKVTVARWYTPKGRNLSNGGITPDYVVTPTKEDFAAGRDVQFDKALQLLVNPTTTK